VAEILWDDFKKKVKGLATSYPN